MAFKINISDKDGKTYKLETESELSGKKINETIKGEEINADLTGYELEITGISDSAGFPGLKEIEGNMLTKKLLKKGDIGIRKIPVRGFRKRKTVRGNTISEKTSQINTILKKQGGKKLEEIFKAETPAETPTEGESPKEEVKEKPAEQVKEEAKSEDKPAEEKREETKAEEKTEDKPKEEAK